MIERARIQRFAEKIARQFQPQRIILFGSYAYGQPTPDSDVDLLVVMRHEGRAREQAVRIRQSIDETFPMDLIVRSPETVAQRLAWGGCFLREITERGEALYEAHDR